MIAVLENLFIFALSCVVIVTSLIFILGFCISVVLVVEDSHASPSPQNQRSHDPLGSVLLNPVFRCSVRLLRRTPYLPTLHSSYLTKEYALSSSTA